MPQQSVSLAEQVKTYPYLNGKEDNYVPVNLIEEYDLLQNGGATDVVETFKQWTELDGDPNAASPLKTVTSIEVIISEVAGNFDMSLFGGETALTGGIDIQLRIRGVTVLLGNFKNILDLYDIFDTVEHTTDTKATTQNTVTKAIIDFEKRGKLLQLVDTTLGFEDAVIITIKDDNSGLSTTVIEAKAVIKGYGYVSHINPNA